ncbi:hypothetical protein CVT26_012980 [Gymnopilus dilepis]|uniref:Uncharacterized protein n=1 Tax=Gymnopilus dilepis TaxID=231916 RepID=A0A409YNZ0_9AGAR|nr:hypothetical protein CVT26_012980 [Gymnopilus dilepis]
MSFIVELEAKKPDMRKTAASLPNSDASFELKMDVAEEAICISKKDPDSAEASSVDGLLVSDARVSRPFEPKSGDEMSDVQEYFKTEAGIKRESSQMSGDTEVNMDGGGTSSLKCQLNKGLPSSYVKLDGGDELLAFQLGKQHMKEDLEMPCTSGFVSRGGVRSAPKTTRVSEMQGEDEEALEQQGFSATTTVAEDDSTSTGGSLSGASLQDDLKAPKCEGLQASIRTAVS